jgi:hypothetical protein
MPEPAVLPLITLRGLEPEAIYKVEGGGPKRSGKAWMELGFKLVLRNMQSRMLRIRRVG